MGKVGDKLLQCRQCGIEFTFTEGEQEFYMQRGLSQPSRCPQCRLDNRNRGARLLCAGCGSELGRDRSGYCSTCAENLKLQAECELRMQQEKMEELETRLKYLAKLEIRIASVTAEVEKGQQTAKALQRRVEALELDNSRLAAELGSAHALEASVHDLRQQFEALQQSYVRDVESFLQSLLEIRGALTQGENANLLQRARLALIGRICKRSKAPRNLRSPPTGRGEVGGSETVVCGGEEAAASGLRCRRQGWPHDNSTGEVADHA